MACSINLFNPEHNQSMSPRISFSNDFAVADPPPPPPGPPRSTDPSFEFSVGTLPMIAADELFYKGRMLPLQSGQQNYKANTLRDELMGQDDHDDCWDPSSVRPPKAGIRWKELLGLKKGSTNIVASASASASASAAAKQNQCGDGVARSTET